MTVLLILLVVLLGGFLLVRAVSLGEVPPITDDEWEDWKAFVRRRDAHLLARQGR